MSETHTDIGADDHGEALTAVTSLPMASRRLFAHIAGSPRRSLASWIAAMLGCAELPGRVELAGLRPATRFLIVGLAASIGLVGLATAVAVASVELSTSSLPAWLGAHTSGSPNSGLRSPGNFENILQRPLFSRSRQGAVVEAPVTAMAPPPPAMLDQNVTLKGVFMNGILAKAFLTSAQDPVGVWVQANDDVSGWRVVQVKPDQVLLEGRGEKLLVPLSVNGPAK